MGNRARTDSLTPDGRLRWIQEWRTDDALDFRLGRDRRELIAEWAGLGQLRSTRSGEVYRFTPHPAASDWAVEKLLGGPVQALLRHLQGRMSLHASAVERDGAAMLFLGSSLCGKSTFAAELCRREGFAMIADDVAFLEQHVGEFSAIPSEATHWLRQDAAAFLGATAVNGEKTPLAPARVARAPVAVKAVVYLAFDEALGRATLRRLPGRLAFCRLRTSLFRFIVDEPKTDLRDFGNLAALHAKVPLSELTRRRALSNLGECVDLLLGAWPHFLESSEMAGDR